MTKQTDEFCDYTAQQRRVIKAWHRAARLRDSDIVQFTPDQQRDYDALLVLFKRVYFCDLVALEKIFDSISAAHNDMTNLPPTTIPVVGVMKEDGQVELNGE